MRQCWLALVLMTGVLSLAATDELYLNGLNEASYIYRTAQDSLHSYFRDALGITATYRDITLGMKFITELPKYPGQNPYASLDANTLRVQWTERFLEYNRDNLLLHGGLISESFGSGMVMRAWQDLEFDTDTRLDGFLAKYDNNLKLKALYGVLPNLNNANKSDLAYGLDAELPAQDDLTVGASAFTLRTLTALSTYNQQDVFALRANLSNARTDTAVEYAQTSLFDNGAANRTGSALAVTSSVYLAPFGFKAMEVGAGYKKYDKFRYRLQDLKVMNYHNETLADNESTGDDEEGLQGSLTVKPSESVSLTGNYAEAWNHDFSKRMNDLYSAVELTSGEQSYTLEYSHVEKLDTSTPALSFIPNDHWQKEMKPGFIFVATLWDYSFEAKTECALTKKTNHDVTFSYAEPYLQLDLGLGKLSLSGAVKTHWVELSEITDSPYWVNGELKCTVLKQTDLTLFAGRQSGGKVCRNGVCRYVSPFQGVKVEATTRF